MTHARSIVLAVMALLLAATSACSGDETATGRAPVVIAGQSFTESDILNQLYAQLLDQEGFRARIEKVGARQLYLGPLGKGSVQLQRTAWRPPPSSSTATRTARTRHRSRPLTSQPPMRS